jgi:hypothetical protein
MRLAPRSPLEAQQMHFVVCEGVVRFVLRVIKALCAT